MYHREITPIDSAAQSENHSLSAQADSDSPGCFGNGHLCQFDGALIHQHQPAGKVIQNYFISMRHSSVFTSLSPFGSPFLSLAALVSVFRIVQVGRFLCD